MQQSAFCRLRAIFSGTFCTRLHIAALTAAMGNIKIVRALEHANEIAVRSVLLYQVAQLVRLGGFLNDKDNAAERLGVITHTNELARQHLDKRIAAVDFSNILKRGDLKVTKTSEDGLVEGMKFHLYGTSLSGIPVDEYAVTDSTGVAIFSDILISGDTPYTLEEVETANRYVVPAAQNVTVNWNEVTNATVHNVLKKFRVTVAKTDRETGTPQGDATLAGAVYGIYDGDTLIDTYTTDSNGSFTTKYYVCGDNWTIREISPSEGYLLDETSYHVGAEATLYTVELNDTSNDVTEQVIKGRISIIKHTDDGSTQIETPEEGAEFQVYLKSAGSYDSAKDSERDTLVCDENGYAETKDLPYGIYTVHQTKGWEGREMIGDFDVYISSDGEVYRYLINNRLFESYLKVVKKDAETGKTIPLAGAGFQIYDESGNLVTMQ